MLLQNRQLRKVPSFLIFEHQLHKLVPVLAAVGAFLSFFHQGSLGGLYGVLRGHPFVFRQGFAIWPSTFFLFILSAVAVGPSFLILVTAAAEKVTGGNSCSPVSFASWDLSLACCSPPTWRRKQSTLYVWLNITSPSRGFGPSDYYSYWPFGSTFLFAEIVPLGLLPAFLLIVPITARKRGWLLLGAALACGGVLLNRFVFTVQTLALPTLAFDRVPAVHAKLAGGRNLRRRDRLRCDRVFLVLPLPAAV